VIARWKAAVGLVLAAALGAVSAGGDTFVVFVLVVACVASGLAGWWIGREADAHDRRGRRAVVRSIERHRAEVAVEHENVRASESTGSIRFTGPVGDRHPALFSRYDPDEDERPRPALVDDDPRWRRLR
jgi:hypothetical protein